MKRFTIVFGLLLSCIVLAGPVLQMNQAFMALSELIPYITDRTKFMEPKNAPLIEKKIAEMQKAFHSAKHSTIIKEDIFAPSYNLINENIKGTSEAFKKGKKDYAHWRLKEITSLCLDCHTRIPSNISSSFQNGELSIDESKFDDVYNLGIAQLIVRRYVDAKMSFKRSIQDRLIKKEFNDIILPYKQLLLIDTKVQRNPENLITEFTTQLGHKNLPDEVIKTLKAWISRLQYWKTNKFVLSGLNSDNEVGQFITKELIPLKKRPLYEDGQDVDLLFVSGLLSNYLFENPSSKKVAEIGYWIGWSEKFLKRENFFGSGDLFLKQCIRKYPSDPVAKKCFEEYEESMNFEFSGSSGTHIPEDVKKELDELRMLVNQKK